MIQGKIFRNAKWIIGCKIVQSLLQLLIGMITARFLGPSNYGLISYATSLTAFAVPFMELGMSSTLVRDYVASPEREGEIAGTALVMNLVSALLCMICVVGFAMVFNRNEPITVVVCVLYSISLFFRAAQMIQYWFQAKLLAKHSSLAALAAYVIVSVYKIYLLVAGKSVYWFAVVHSVEYGATGLLMFATYKKLNGPKLRISWRVAKELFSSSRYYILASLMVTVFQNVDHIMLKLVSGDEANGIYTTVVTCTGVANFLYVAIVDSVRPVILSNYKKNREEFEQNVIALYSVITYISLAHSLCFYVLSEWIVLLLFGQEYLTAVPILRVHTWILVFSNMGTVRNVWILAEEKHGLLWRINLWGAVTNVLLNALFIPAIGALGASIASVLTQIITNFLIGFILRPMIPNNRLLLRGLNPRGILEFYKMLRD